MYSRMYQTNQTLMENREIISIGILFFLSGLVTFLYLIKNSAMFPDLPSLRSEDENSLTHYLIAAILIFLIVLLCSLYLMGNYVRYVL
jgi:uncharacterized membrane protein YqhA